MVLLSKLFFFASIPCYVLGARNNIFDAGYNVFSAGNRPTTKSDYELACNWERKAIENSLMAYTDDRKKVKYLIETLAKERLSHHDELLYQVKKAVRENAEIVANMKSQLDNMAHVKDITDMVIRTCLTCKALEDLEMFAFPFVLYRDSNLNRYTKWIIALEIYKNHILDEIRADLKELNLDYEDFANAADDVHSLISEKFARPLLELYAVPNKRPKDIKDFCKFLDLVYLDNVPPANNLEEMSPAIKQDRVLPGMEESSSAKLPRNKEVINKKKRQAAEVTCWNAFRSRAYVNVDPEVVREVRTAPVLWYSATIVIQDMNSNMYNVVTESLDKIIKDHEYEEKVHKITSRKIYPQTWDVKDPKFYKRSPELDIVFHLVCKPASDLNEDPATKITDALKKQFPGKKFALQTTFTAYTIGTEQYRSPPREQ